MYEWTGDSAPPEFDQVLAESYIGKYILIGLTYLAHDDSFIEQVQMHGLIESASRDGIQIALRGKRKGETWVMPPNLDSVSAAKPGTYSLRSTGETVEDPDLLATWTVRKALTS